MKEGGGSGGGLSGDVGFWFRPKVELELPMGDGSRKFKDSTVKLTLQSLLEVSFLLLSAHLLHFSFCSWLFSCLFALVQNTVASVGPRLHILNPSNHSNSLARVRPKGLQELGLVLINSE